MKKQHGLTLLELMIALALGLFIIAATLSIFITTVRSSSDTIKATRLNHDLEMALNLMGNDIRRAGYWGNARINSNARNNPFTREDSTTPLNHKNVNIINYNGGANNCILYTYDADADGTVDLDEYFGFRLTVANGRGRLEMKLTAKANTVADGASTTECNNGSWQTFIDNNTLDITKLRFSFFSLDTADDSSPCSNTTLVTCLKGTSRCTNLTTTATPDFNETLNCAGIVATPTPTADLPHTLVVKRVVNIIITGEVIGENGAVRKSVTSSVQIRNNRFVDLTS